MRSRVARRRGGGLIPILCLLFLPGAAGPARADGYLDVYGGRTANGTTDVHVSERTASGTTSAAATVDLSSKVEFGARFGAWLPRPNWVGLTMDVGYFQADGPGVDIDAYPLSFGLALRAPLFPTPDRSGGRLQPYAMGGVSFYILDITVQLDGMGGDSFNNSWPLPGNPGVDAIGPYAAAGLVWQPADHLALFGEYRYSEFDVGYDTTNSMIWPTMNGRVDAATKTGHILLGLSYRFGDTAPVSQGRPDRP